MKQDTQHLEFLISQYVDDTLDAPNRKFVEKQIVSDPAARRLLKDHREMQEMLDDWGSRIPLVDWNAFDRDLNAKLELEQTPELQISRWRIWLRPVAAAAAITMAVAVGYAWHAASQNVGTGDGLNMASNTAPASIHTVQIEQPLASGNQRVVNFVDDPALRQPAAPDAQARGVTIEGAPAGNLGRGQGTAFGGVLGKAIPGSARAEAPLTQPSPDALH
jgi:anti-sigma factor RsiW